MMKDCRNANHRILSAAVLLELEDLGKRHGVTFKVNGGHVGDVQGMMKLEFRLTDTGGRETQEQQMWRYYATSYGFKLDDLGREFTSRGVRYKITGIEPSRPKYPISAERVHDKRAFKFGASTVKMGLPMKMAA